MAWRQSTSSVAAEVTAAPAAQAIWFGNELAPLFGWYHRPAPERSIGQAAVLCNPFGYEALTTHRTYRLLAERLAARGIATLRFDYEGTGDSSGEDPAPGRVASWRSSIAAALAESRQRSRGLPVTLVGLRLGASLALLAAADDQHVAALVLWTPFIAGKHLVRELRAVRMMGESGSDRADPPAPTIEEGGGFQIDAAAAEELGRINLLAEARLPAPRILLFGRDDVKPDERLVTRLRSLGADVAVGDGAGYGVMIQDPHRAEVPVRVIEQIGNWIAALPPGQESEPSVKAKEWSDTAVMAASTAAPGLTTGGGARTAVTERFFRFGDGSRLFGIISAPVSTRGDAPPPTVLLLSSGANHRVGPNRMYVSLARLWASLGFRVLRFDLGGLGDSLPHPGGRENHSYPSSAVGDVQAAMSALETEPPGGFVLTGLCSGAHTAFQAGRAGGPIGGIMPLNPLTFYWKEGDSLDIPPSRPYVEARYYRQSLFQGDKWKKALRGEVDFSYIVTQVLFKKLALRFGARLDDLKARLGLLDPSADHLSQDLCQLDQAGIETFFVFSDGDAGLDYLRLHGRQALRQLGRKAEFGVTVIPDADHTFSTLAMRERLYLATSARLLARFGQPVGIGAR